MVVKVGTGLPLNEYYANMAIVDRANEGAFTILLDYFLGVIKICNLLNQ